LAETLKIFSSEATYPNDYRFNTKISHFVLIQQKTWLPWAIFASLLIYFFKCSPFKTNGYIVLMM
jgi:hypothetical protein